MKVESGRRGVWLNQVYMFIYIYLFFRYLTGLYVCKYVFILYICYRADYVNTYGLL